MKQQLQLWKFWLKTCLGMVAFTFSPPVVLFSLWYIWTHLPDYLSFNCQRKSVSLLCIPVHFLAVISVNNLHTKTFMCFIKILCQLLHWIWNIWELKHSLWVKSAFFTNIIRLSRGTESRNYLFMECKLPCFCRHQKMETRKMLQQIEGRY